MVYIKPEIKLDSPEEEKDVFEPETELYIPGDDTQAWLIRVPRDVWHTWSNIYDNAPDGTKISLGRMWVRNPKAQQSPLDQEVRIILNDIPQQMGVPKKYEMKLDTTDYSNVVVFSESDLERPRSNSGLKPGGISKEDRYGPGYKTQVLKRTGLMSKVVHMGKAMHVQDANYNALRRKQWEESAVPKQKATYIDQVDKNLLQAGSGLSMGGLGSSRRSKGKKRDAPDKFVRMEKADLMRGLEACFRKYQYWSTATLRLELKQPEAWIKETLEEIATFVRTGDFASTWKLKPEYANVLHNHEALEAVAKVESGGELMTRDEDEDEGEDEFEDVGTNP
ncbi:hypothetical protein K470DRAFT_257623 [Piedraia hortae CBS 480.64]|uniref:Transcription initiation factor IIF subunit beta n=1 Tax=Piedraia hortae CBS 480.64 TaxID=1314780 RepID=A0A6A7BZV0_9PEZI|nr:hypothetical protein K470DRAFT_257623 [Piedraia hortae CBS 480.64]